MANVARRMAMVMAAGVMLVAPRVSAAADSSAASSATGTPFGHVRSANPAIVALIREATEQSATFRKLVETIDASDSYVYVSEGDCGRGVRACFGSVTEAGPSRIMRVTVDIRKADCDLMGSIGHELRHTVEVISNPWVRSTSAKFLYYEQIGTHGRTGTQETWDAVDAGNTVRSEVRAFNRRAKAE